MGEVDASLCIGELLHKGGLERISLLYELFKEGLGDPSINMFPSFWIKFKGYSIECDTEGPKSSIFNLHKAGLNSLSCKPLTSAAW